MKKYPSRNICAYSAGEIILSVVSFGNKKRLYARKSQNDVSNPSFFSLCSMLTSRITFMH